MPQQPSSIRHHPPTAAAPPAWRRRAARRAAPQSRACWPLSAGAAGSRTRTCAQSPPRAPCTPVCGCWEGRALGGVSKRRAEGGTRGAVKSASRGWRSCVGVGRGAGVEGVEKIRRSVQKLQPGATERKEGSKARRLAACFGCALRHPSWLGREQLASSASRQPAQACDAGQAHTLYEQVSERASKLPGRLTSLVAIGSATSGCREACSSTQLSS